MFISIIFKHTVSRLDILDVNVMKLQIVGLTFEENKIKYCLIKSLMLKVKQEQ